MDDSEIIERIGALVDEEHQLHSQSHEGEPLNDDERERLSALEVQLDQCWDLLRQRRALRESGGDPSEAHVRDETTVERYRQ